MLPVGLQKKTGLKHNTVKKILVRLLNQGHKVALTDICREETVLKYGKIIGEAKQNIKGVVWVHTHNLGIEEMQKRCDGRFSRI
jgi:hypothetical protein